MKGKNKILIGCLALLLVLSVGYALFSDTITINGTATAKGEFLVVVELADELSEEDIDVLSFYPSQGIINNPSISIKDNTVTTDVELGAPGSTYNFIFKVTNKGTIPARLNQIYDVNKNSVIIDENGLGTYNPSSTAGEGDITAYMYFDMGLLDNSFEGDIIDRGFITMDSTLVEAVLNPGESVYFLVEYMWNSSDTTPGDPLELEWSIKFDWVQVTVE